MNVARRLRANAEAHPDRTALIYPSGGAYAKRNYREVDRASDAFARGFARAGITKGTKTIVMVKPGFEFFAILFALFKLGAVPVIVDPGMGVRRMLHCYRTVGATAFIGIPVAHVVRVLSPTIFRSLETAITVGWRLFWGGPTLAELASYSDEPMPIQDTTPDDPLAVNFTTGSTGPAKGVVYTHGMLDAIVERVRADFEQGPSTVTFATLPLFVLFDLLNGSTSVLPPMDPTKPAKVDPRAMIDGIRRFGATHMFASPAFLDRVGSFAARRGVTLPWLRCVVSGGAPVSPRILKEFERILAPDARLLATYGATEALPMAMIDARDVLAETRAGTSVGKGTCVGLPSVDARLLRITDAPIPTWSDALRVEPGEVGEIVVSGPIVSPRYHDAHNGAPSWNALAKVKEGARVWHRTGDLGWFDTAGRLWFAGRKSQRVITARGPAFTAQWEGVFDAHPDVLRTALVAVSGRCVICVEPRSTPNRTALETELRAVARAHGLDVHAFLFHDAFPVDIRHNAKINREKLAVWAARELGRTRQRPVRYIVPILGWLFLAYGLVVPLEHSIVRALWFVDVFSSVGVHGLQLALALPRGRNANIPTWKTVLLTFLLGATWWRFLEPEDTDASSTAAPGSDRAG